MPKGWFIRFELADGELVELGDDDVPGVFRELYRHKSEDASMSTATLLSWQFQFPQEERCTIELTELEGQALWDAVARRHAPAHRY